MNRERWQCSLQVCVSSSIILFLFYSFQLPNFAVVCAVIGVFFVGPDMGKVRNAPLFVFLGFSAGALVGLTWVSYVGVMPGLAAPLILLWIAVLSYVGDCFIQFKMLFNFIAAFPLVMLAAMVSQEPQLVPMLAKILLSAAVLSTSVFLLVRYTLFHPIHLPAKIEKISWKEMGKTLKTFKPDSFFVAVNKVITLVCLFALQATCAWTSDNIFPIAMATAVIVPKLTSSQTRGAIFGRVGGALSGGALGLACIVVLSYFPFVWLLLTLLMLVIWAAAYYTQMSVKANAFSVQFILAFFMTLNPSAALAANVSVGICRMMGIALGCFFVFLVSYTLRWEFFLCEKYAGLSIVNLKVGILNTGRF